MAMVAVGEAVPIAKEGDKGYDAIRRRRWGPLNVERLTAPAPVI